MSGQVGGGGGVQGGCVKEELKLLWKCKKIGGGGSRGGCWSRGRGLVGSNVGGRG